MSWTAKSNSNPKNEYLQEEILEKRKNLHKKGNKCIRNKTPMRTKVRKMNRKVLEKK
jgi:hypothetical protein